MRHAVMLIGATRLAAEFVVLFVDAWLSLCRRLANPTTCMANQAFELVI
jgi:hypothetical protein